MISLLTSLACLLSFFALWRWYFPLSTCWIMYSIKGPQKLILCSSCTILKFKWVLDNSTNNWIALNSKPPLRITPLFQWPQIHCHKLVITKKIWPVTWPNQKKGEILGRTQPKLEVYSFDPFSQCFSIYLVLHHQFLVETTIILVSTVFCVFFFVDALKAVLVIFCKNFF